MAAAGPGCLSGPYLIGALSGGGAWVHELRKIFTGPFQDFYPKIMPLVGIRHHNSTSGIGSYPPIRDTRFQRRAAGIRTYHQQLRSRRRGNDYGHRRQRSARRSRHSVAGSQREGAHFNSQDLENGNPEKGLSGRAGDGDGNWRLNLETDLEIEHLAYIRTADGFVTNMHEVAAEIPEGSNRYHVPFFNPGKQSESGKQAALDQSREQQREHRNHRSGR